MRYSACIVTIANSIHTHPFQDGVPDIDWKYRFRWTAVAQKSTTRAGGGGQPDGIHWKLIDNWATSAIVDGATHWMLDGASGKYVLYGRMLHARPEVAAAWKTNDWFQQWFSGRAVARLESTDFVNWDFTKPGTAPIVLTADLQDPRARNLFDESVPYEGIYIGLVQVFHSTPEDATLDVQLAVSRDTVHFTRVEDRRPFLALWTESAVGIASTFQWPTTIQSRAAMNFVSINSGRLYRHNPYSGSGQGRGEKRHRVRHDSTRPDSWRSKPRSTRGNRDKADATQGTDRSSQRAVEVRRDPG
jgi:hypothetical protein